MSITVCIPVFNRRGLIGDAIQSALAQEVEQLEVVVVDNCSTDGTWEYLQTLRDPRLRVFRNDSNIGMFGNFNRCGALAQGENILFLCSDDRLHPGFLARALDKLRAEPRAAMINSHGRMVDENGHRFAMAGKFLAPGLYDGGSITKAYYWVIANYGINLFNYPSGILFRGDAARHALPFRDDIGGPADIDYFFKALECGGLLADDTEGCTITVHRNQTANKNKQSGTMIVELVNMARLHLDRPGTQPFWRSIRRQLGASALIWAIRQLCGSNHAGLRAVANFDTGSLAFLIIAGARRGMFMALYRMGLCVEPYAKRL